MVRFLVATLMVFGLVGLAFALPVAYDVDYSMSGAIIIVGILVILLVMQAWPTGKKYKPQSRFSRTYGEAMTKERLHYARRTRR